MTKKKKKNPAKKKEPILSEDERNELKQEGELPKKRLILKENKQLIGFILVIILFFAAFIGPYLFIQSQKTFTYAGVAWQTEQYGEETLFHTRFGKCYKGVCNGAHNTYLKTDPRKNNIPVDIGPLSLYPEIIISQSPEVLECYKQILVTDALYQITAVFPFIKNKTIAITNETLAKEIKKDYATCENKPEETTIIQVQLGEESKITSKPEDDCYFITIKNCDDNLLVAESFILEAIKQLNAK